MLSKFRSCLYEGNIFGRIHWLNFRSVPLTPGSQSGSYSMEKKQLMAGGHERNISASSVRPFGRNLVFFFSNEQIVNFRPNVALFHERRFHLVGLMVGTSILHVGPAFPFFPRSIYEYIARDQMAVDCDVANVANPSTIHVINMVHIYIWTTVCVCAILRFSPMLIYSMTFKPTIDFDLEYGLCSNTCTRRGAWEHASLPMCRT